MQGRAEGDADVERAWKQLKSTTGFAVPTRTPEKIQSGNRKQTKAERAVVIVVGLAVVSLILLIYTYPYYPKSPLGWVFYIAIGIPSYLFFEWLGSKLFSKKIGRMISKKSFSVMRILYALFITLSLYGTIAFVYYLVFLK